MSIDSVDEDHPEKTELAENVGFAEYALVQNVGFGHCMRKGRNRRNRRTRRNRRKGVDARDGGWVDEWMGKLGRLGLMWYNHGHRCCSCAIFHQYFINIRCRIIKGIILSTIITNPPKNISSSLFVHRRALALHIHSCMFGINNHQHSFEHLSLPFQLYVLTLSVIHSFPQRVR